jgi:hypothetical protein
MDKDETPLQMATRHLREGDVRIGKQEDLIVEMEVGGREEQLPLAHALLAKMHAFQAEGRKHMEYEMSKYDSASQQP